MTAHGHDRHAALGTIRPLVLTPTPASDTVPGAASTHTVDTSTPTAPHTGHRASSLSVTVDSPMTQSHPMSPTCITQRNAIMGMPADAIAITTPSAATRVHHLNRDPSPMGAQALAPPWRPLTDDDDTPCSMCGTGQAHAVAWEDICTPTALDRHDRLHLPVYALALHDVPDMIAPQRGDTVQVWCQQDPDITDTPDLPIWSTMVAWDVSRVTTTALGLHLILRHPADGNRITGLPYTSDVQGPGGQGTVVTMAITGNGPPSVNV